MASTCSSAILCVARGHGIHLRLRLPSSPPQFLRYIILLSNLIPISLYVTLEVVKVLQCVISLNPDRRVIAAHHLAWWSSPALHRRVHPRCAGHHAPASFVVCRKMYYKPSDTPFQCRTTTLNEELGQARPSTTRIPLSCTWAQTHPQCDSCTASQMFASMAGRCNTC